MKILILVRHAKSSWHDPYLDDFDRPLNKRGKHDAPVMADRFVARGEKPDLLVSSTAKRAITTATIFARALDFPVQDIVQEPRIYEASIADLLWVIRQLDDACQKVVLFGHNPGFTGLANALCKAQINNVPTCGIVSMSFQLAHWTEIEEGSGKMEFFDFPKRKV